MTEATFTFRVDESLKQEFSNFAKDIDRSGAQLLRDFMRDFVKQQQEAASYDAWYQKQVQIGLDEANAGQLVPQEEVKSRFEAKRASLLAKLAAKE
jgi:predicted transcriptional regulator